MVKKCKPEIPKREGMVNPKSKRSDRIPHLVRQDLYESSETTGPELVRDCFVAFLHPFFRGFGPVAAEVAGERTTSETIH